MLQVRPNSLRVLTFCLVAIVVACPACATIRVKRVAATDLLDAWKRSAVGCCDLSPRSRQTLRQLDLEPLYDKDPAAAATRLREMALQTPQPDYLFTLAEMSYLRGRNCEKLNPTESICHYYLSAGYAYHYLFATCDHSDLKAGDIAARLTPADPFDPRFRLACEMYNAGLSKCIAAAQRAGRLDPRKQLTVPTTDGRGFTLDVVHAGFPWKDADFGPLYFCDEFEVTGLANNYHSYGLGVPLICARAADSDGPGRSYYPKSVSFPATAFFRFEGTLADLGTRRNGRLELYNPLTIQAIELNGRSVPLETDLTTPFAYFLANNDLANLEITGFLHPDRVRAETGIYLVEPYQPGKIPVLFVHGLLSSPITWAPLYNDLRSDPVLREKYQFFFYFYPTSNPYLATAADLRRSLLQLRRDLDPKHEDKAFDDMVLVGHSMGGLVSRLLTLDGGDDYFALVSPKPLRDLVVPDDARTELQQVFYFERLPLVKRVVFLGTPHRGSRLSPSPLGRLAVHLASLPKQLVSDVGDIIADNPDLKTSHEQDAQLTSVDLLDPESPALKVLNEHPRPAGVMYHSVVGVTHDNTAKLERLLAGASPCEEGDGVVPYTSAHLDSANSELIVPADHSHVHQHPLAVLEVRRILLEHIKEQSGR
jgi:pimeloyl-ACP methyl ester carboxylesterase